MCRIGWSWYLFIVLRGGGGTWPSYLIKSPTLDRGLFQIWLCEMLTLRAKRDRDTHPGSNDLQLSAVATDLSNYPTVL